MKRNRKYNKNLVQENLMNGLRHIVFILIIGFVFANPCNDPDACNFGQDGDCEYELSCGTFGPDQITGCDCIGIPEEFQFVSSVQFAYYYFSTVTINGDNVDLDDWVGAFNGDICVGARQWGVCGGAACDVPAMGIDAFQPEITVGYMQNGDIPTFKIYDASLDAYYDAVASEDIPWANFGLYPNDELSADDITILGCTDSNACNYDSFATDDDGSCNYGELDCNGICGGDAVSDECGVCDPDPSNDNTDCWFVDIEASFHTTQGLLFDYNSRLGMHIAAEDGYNAASDPYYSNNSYMDVVDINIDLPFDQLDVYFPHPDWEDEIPDAFFGNTDIEDDIRKWVPGFAFDSLDIDNPILVNEQIYLAQKNKIWNLTVFSDGENLIGQDSVDIQFDITNQLPNTDYLKAFILLHDGLTNISIIEEIQDDGMFTINNFESPTQLTIFIGTEDIIPSVNIISPISGEIFSINKEELEISIELENPDMIDVFEIFFEVNGNYSEAISMSIDAVEESVLTIDKDQYYSYLDDLMDGNYLDNVNIHIEIIDIAAGHVEGHEEHHYHVSVGPLTFSRDTSTTSFETGLHLLAPPLSENYNLINIFGSDTYDCDSTGCSGILTANSGTGFYVESNGSPPYVTFTVGNVLSEKTLILQEGWNLIGNPLVTQFDVDSLIITFNTTDYYWPDAVKYGYISPTPIIYDNAKASHVGTESLSTAAGFWVYSFHNDMEISFIPFGSSTATAPEIEDSDYWNLSLFAKENTEYYGGNFDDVIGSEIVIGIHEDANDAIANEDQKNLPLEIFYAEDIIRSYTQLSIKNDSESSIYRDIRSYHETEITWEISVHDFQPSHSEEGIVLTWELRDNNVPNALDAYDYYLNKGSGQLINMKTDDFVIAYQNDFSNGMSITAELKDQYIGCTHPQAANYNEVADGEDGQLCADGVCLGGNQADYCDILAFSFGYPGTDTTISSYSVPTDDANTAFELPILLSNPQSLAIEGFQFDLEYDATKIQINAINLSNSLLENYYIEVSDYTTQQGDLSIIAYLTSAAVYSGGGAVMLLSGEVLDDENNDVIEATISFSNVQINENPNSFGHDVVITFGVNNYNISGELIYYATPGKPVSGATIDLIGSEYSSTTSDNGNFMLEDVLVINENYELTVFKNEYQGFLDNYFDGLSAVDASRIARYSSGLLYGTDLDFDNEKKLLAANVNFDYRCEYDAVDGNGTAHYSCPDGQCSDQECDFDCGGIPTTETECGEINGVSWMPNISGFDATRVAKYAAGIIDHLDSLCSRHWIFFDPNDELMFDMETCSDIPYLISLNSNISDLSFVGIRLGDVTGNWAAPLSRQNENYFVDNPMVAVELDEIIKLPIYLPNNVEIEGIDLTIQYDPEVFSLIGFNNGNSILDKSVYSTIINEGIPGMFKLVSYANSIPVNDNGLLGYIKFKVVSQTTAHSTISIVEMEVNEIPEGGFLIVDGIDSGNISRGFDFQIIAVPDVFTLNQNYPNPFNPSTNIQFELPIDGDVEICIYDLKGSLIDELMNGYMEAGYHQIKWDGSHRSSGMYFIRMIADNGNYIKMSKMMLVK